VARNRRNGGEESGGILHQHRVRQGPEADTPDPDGIIAFVKQTLLDADQYATAWNIYKANPGATRPSTARASKRCSRRCGARCLFLLQANTEIEIRRAFDLADAFKLNAVLTGCWGSGQVAALAEGRGVPVLWPSNSRKRPASTDPDAREELDSLRRRWKPPAMPLPLAKAGVRFAFISTTWRLPGTSCGMWTPLSKRLDRESRCVPDA